MRILPGGFRPEISRNDRGEVNDKAIGAAIVIVGVLALGTCIYQGIKDEGYPEEIGECRSEDHYGPEITEDQIGVLLRFSEDERVFVQDDEAYFTGENFEDPADAPGELGCKNRHGQLVATPAGQQLAAEPGSPVVLGQPVTPPTTMPQAA